MDTSESDYVFDMAWERERERLTANERYWDPFSIRILERLGVVEGMRVLDVGAGGGTIAQWCAQHVAPSGSVLAVDLNARFIMALDEPNLEARQMDLFAGEFPRDSFDVVHARCLLEHLPRRVGGLKRLIAAARPGGLVAVCDFGGELGGPVYPTPDDLIVQEVFLAVVNEAGWDHTWAPVIAEHMRQFGLEEVGAESVRRYSVGGDVGSVRITQFSISVLRNRMMATGRVTSDQIDKCVERLRAPTVGHLSFETWYAWGRRPVSTQIHPQTTHSPR
jgi:ubiquinone/menaquinone biosynthesis C-methylase UbiE